MHAVERRDRAVQARARAHRTATSARDRTASLVCFARSGLTSRSTRSNGSAYSCARSTGQSRKSMTHRDGEPSGRELRSSPLRYGRTTSALRGSRVEHAPRLLGVEHEAHARARIEPWNDRSAARLEPLRPCPSTRLRSVSDGVIPATGCSVEHALACPLAVARPDRRHLEVRAARPRLARDRAVQRPAGRRRAGRARPRACRPARSCSWRSARSRRPVAAVAAARRKK